MWHTKLRPKRPPPRTFPVDSGPSGQYDSHMIEEAQPLPTSPGGPRGAGVLTTSPGGATPQVNLAQPALVQTPTHDGVWCGAVSISEDVSVLGVRDLTAEEVLSLPPPGRTPDQARLAAQRGQAPARAVERLKTRHHEMARLMAAGLSDSEIGAAMSVTLGHLALLRRSPAFQQLLFTYMSIRDQEAVNIGARIKQAASIALEKLTEKLAETDSNELPLDTLRRTTTDLLDRSGHSPVSKTMTLSGALSAEDIRDIKNLHRPAAAVSEPGAQSSGPPTLEAEAAPSPTAVALGKLMSPPGVGSGPGEGQARIEGPRTDVRALRSEGVGEGPAVRPSLDDLDLDPV